MVLRLKGLVDAHFEYYPGNTYKTENIRHLDFSVRSVKSIHVVVISFFPFLRTWVELVWGIPTMGASVIRAWKISVGASTAIDSARDDYNLVSAVITAGCPGDGNSCGRHFCTRTNHIPAGPKFKSHVPITRAYVAIGRARNGIPERIVSFPGWGLIPIHLQ